MQSAQYYRVTGQGSRVMANKNNLYKRRPELKTEPSGFPPGRIILVLAIVVGCLGMLWPRIFSPLVFGEAPGNTDEEAILSDPALRERGRGPPRHERKTPPLPVRTIDKEWKGRGGPMPGMRPPIGGPGIQPPEPRGGSTLGMMMPIYTIAIIVFFVYTTFKVMFKNKEDDEEEVDDTLFEDNIKYDEENYNKLMKQYNKDDRAPVNPQQENTLPSTNLLTQSGSKVERLKKHDCEKDYYVDGGIKKECEVEAEKVEAEKVEAEKVEAEKVEAEKVEAEKVEAENVEAEKIDQEKFASNSPSKSKDSDKISEKTETGCKETKLKEEEKLSNDDPRDLEIQLLKSRLEQTEAALERIVAHMGSVTSRLAMQDLQMGGQKHCCTTTH